jgi:protein-L-isoaspartate(D-aspartate) O-methyltransferase
MNPNLMDVERARFNMVEQQIRPWRVLDASLLESHFQLRREDFVPPSMRKLAFCDMEIPLLIDGRDSGECMLAPKVDARLVQALDLAREEHVLEVGTGSGWLAALLATRAARVLSLERHPAIAAFAHENLLRAGLQHVEVVAADASQASAASTPEWDAIVLSGSVEQIPVALVNKLKVGGRMALIVGRPPVMTAQLLTRTASGAPVIENLFETLAPALRGFARPSHFQL